MCPKTSAHPLQSRVQEQGSENLVCPLCGYLGRQESGGPWDFRTPRQGLNPLETQHPQIPASAKYPSAVNLVELPTACRTPCPHPPDPQGLHWKRMLVSSAPTAKEEAGRL